MNGIFSYDSKLMQTLSFIADLFVCNLIFLLCCIPIVTIGPALSGLHYAMRTLGDNQDDRSAIKQFFKGFSSGFGKSMGAWLLMLAAMGILFYTLHMSYTYEGYFVHWGVPFAGLCFALLYTAVIMVFHSQFGCTFKQLMRNSLVMLFIAPLRCLLVAALTWAPLVLLLIRADFFIQLTPLFLTVWYSTAFMLCGLLMRKPFSLLIDHHTGEDEIREEQRRKAAAEEAEIEAEAKANLAARAAQEQKEP